MQTLVRLHPPHIVPVEQPVELLDAEREDGLLEVARPVEFIPLEALVPEDEAVALPEQQLDLVASRVDE
jgi:hypothetical protein